MKEEREFLLTRKQWEKKNLYNVLDDNGYSHLNPYYVKKELIDGKVVETMPNKAILDKEAKIRKKKKR